MTPLLWWCLLSVSLAVAAWFAACCALIALRSRQARNHRRSWLGRLLRVSHPEWQGKRVVKPVAPALDAEAWTERPPGVAFGVPALPRCERTDLN